jgi:hypothetical protein
MKKPWIKAQATPTASFELPHFNWLQLSLFFVMLLEESLLNLEPLACNSYFRLQDSWFLGDKTRFGGLKPILEPTIYRS